MRLIILPLVLVSFFFSCNKVYKAGNLEELSYPIETHLRQKVILHYLDTIIKINGSEVPEKWLQYRKLIDIDSVNNRRKYFKLQPEEMYLLSFGGMLILMDVVNPAIRDHKEVERGSP